MYRIGFASDIHRLVEGRKFILAGVNIPFEKGEEAHSDGDVVYHALAESILGALALGDLGKHFPDTIDETKDMDSSLIVKHVISLMKSQNYKVNNVDISITLEKPKLKDYIESMRKNIAEIIETSIENVSVKAGTNEKLDDIGRGLAVKAESYIMLVKE